MPSAEVNQHSQFVCGYAAENKSEGTDPFEAFTDGALGVDAVGHLGAANDHHGHARGFQGFKRLIVGQLS